MKSYRPLWWRKFSMGCKLWRELYMDYGGYPYFRSHNSSVTNSTFCVTFVDFFTHLLKWNKVTKKTGKLPFTTFSVWFECDRRTRWSWLWSLSLIYIYGTKIIVHNESIARFLGRVNLMVYVMLSWSKNFPALSSVFTQKSYFS